MIRVKKDTDKPQSSFQGFPADLFSFLRDLGRNNNQQWFRANYERYQNSLVIPAKEFVREMGEFIQLLNPRFETEPKFNKTIMRIARDMRFTKGKPYRDSFLIGFKRWKWDSELFVYFDKDGVEIGVFLNNKTKQGEPSLRRTLERNPDILGEVCSEYTIGGRYALSQLKNEPQLLSRSFNPRTHSRYLTEVDYLILSRSYSAAFAAKRKSSILGTVIEHFSTLFPLWILAASPNPHADLLSHSKTLGPVYRKK
jgi:uncharacterized protein (DUF2461 family)